MRIGECQTQPFQYARGVRLSPLLFNLYINNLPYSFVNGIKFSSLLYADYLIIPITIKDKNAKLSQCFGPVLWIVYVKVHLTPIFFFGRDETLQHLHKEFDNIISIWYF